MPDTDQKINADKTVERLIDHADRMWKAEEVNSARLETRARLIQSLALALIAFAGFGIYRAGVSDGVLTLLKNNPIPFIIGIGATISPLIFGVISLFGCLANELRRGEDDFAFPVNNTLNNADVPQPTWRDVSTFYAIGCAVEICRQAIFKKRRSHGFNFETGTILDEYREPENWLKPRPILRRFMTASHFMQFTESSARATWEFISEKSPHDAEIFRSTYLAASSLRRWNQRKFDELRVSEMLIVQGTLLLGASVIVFINFMALAAEPYPAGSMLVLGSLFAFYCWLRYKSRLAKRESAFIPKAIEQGYLAAEGDPDIKERHDR